MTKIAKQFVITRGSSGAMLFDGKEFISIAPHKVAAINTNGAGDMFAGAFLYGITQGLDFTTAGKLSSLASAQIVTQFGPRLTPAAHNVVKERILGN
jgi:sugar/nucleoside kinase (ribokinase family)